MAVKARAEATLTGVADGAKGDKGDPGDDFGGAGRLDTLETLVRTSGEGVEVARKVNGNYTSTKAVVTDADYQIVSKGGDVLARYGSDRVELAKNSRYGQISMCDGMYNFTTEGIRFYGTEDAFSAEGGPMGVRIPYSNITIRAGAESRNVAEKSHSGLTLSAQTGGVGAALSEKSISSAGFLVSANGHRASLGITSTQSADGKDNPCPTIDIGTNVRSASNVSLIGGSFPLYERRMLWSSDGGTRYVMIECVLGVVQLTCHDVDRVGSAGWNVGNVVPKCFARRDPFYVSLPSRSSNNTAAAWIEGTSSGKELVELWIYNNGGNDINGTCTWICDPSRAQIPA